jgi:hypothetical protein
LPPAEFARNLGCTRKYGPLPLKEDHIGHDVRTDHTTPLAMTTRLRIALTALAIAGSGCAINAVEPLPLAITINADKLTTVPADSITFDIRAQGGNLLGISVEWGDGTSYVQPTSGARTVRSRVRHAYEHSGVYQVSAAVDDAAGGRKLAALDVTIQ